MGGNDFVYDCYGYWELCVEECGMMMKVLVIGGG